MPDTFGVLVGFAGAAIFYWLPRSRWHRMRIEQEYGEQDAPEALRKRTLMFTIFAVLFLLLGLMSL